MSSEADAPSPASGPPPPAAGAPPWPPPAIDASGRSALTLLGACVGVPAVLAAATALVTTGLSCGDNWPHVIRILPVAAVMLGIGWAITQRAGLWLTVACMLAAGALGTVAGAVAWFCVAFMRCWDF